MKNDISTFDFEAPIQEIYLKIQETRKLVAQNNLSIEPHMKKLEENLNAVTEDIYSKLNNWQITQVARHPRRPYTLDYVQRIFTDYVELHGDRNYGDDNCIICGIARFEGDSCIVVGQQKGRDTKENLKRNFGYPRPEGYRKALRFFQMAEKFNKPIFIFIDTPGAFPGLEGEERSVGEAIARNLRDMSVLRVPVIATVIGEGGSGGALGIGVANSVLMLQYAIYSVISPESCASILWRDSGEKVKAAIALKNSAIDALRLGVIDEIVPEPLGAAHRNYDLAAANLKEFLKKYYYALKKMTPEELVRQRIEKFAAMGVIAKI